MSHIAERTEKNCLNCGTTVLGRYCQDCGQENIEPRETVLHLVTHFVGDLFHFDGKFFSTLKYLMFRPGFLSKEYVRGRRMSYLHPIRMYVFTSFIFFVCLEAKLSRGVDVQKSTSKVIPVLQQREARLRQELLTVTDTARRMEIRDSLVDVKDALTDLRTAGLFPDSAKAAQDSLSAAAGNAKAGKATTGKAMAGKETAGKATGGKETAGKAMADAKTDTDDDDAYIILNPPRDTSHNATSTGIGGVDLPGTVEEYDSAIAHTPPEKRQNWLFRVANRRLIQLREEEHSDKKHFQQEVWAHIQETFPKILFVSLPLFALFLRLLNLRRRKQILYVDHGIFTIHLYCATFIVMLIVMLLDSIKGWTHWTWLGWIMGLLWLVPFFFEYKAMRVFYQQRRAKTILKFILLNTAAGLTVGFVTVIFVLWAVFQV